MAVVTVGFSLLLGILLFSVLIGEPLSRIRARAEYRRLAEIYNRPDWMKAPETFFRSYVATPDHPIEFRLGTNISRTIPQLDGYWKRRTNSSRILLNEAWHLVDSNNVPRLYLTHRFVPRVSAYPALGGKWEGLVSEEAELLLPWLRDSLHPATLPDGVHSASEQPEAVRDSPRWRLLMDYDSERGGTVSGEYWQLRPSPHYAGLPEGHRTWTHLLDEHGFRRGRQPEVEENRLLFIGDSMLFGWGVAEHQTLTEVLGAECARRSVEAEMVNCGVPGYNTRQQLHCLGEQFGRVAPRAVVLCYCANDAEPPLSLPFSRPERFYRYVRWNSWFLERSKRPMRHLLLNSYRVVNNAFASLGIDATWVRDFPVQKFWPRSSGHVGRFDLMRGWRRGRKPAESRAAMEGIASYCAAAEVPLLVCILPAFNGPVREYSLTRIHADVAGWAEELSIPCVDLLPEFAGEEDWQSLRAWEKDGHPSARSVRIMAARLLAPVMGLARQ